MCLPIRETPILFGEEARAQRLKDYAEMQKAFEEGMAEKSAREAANGGIDPWFKQI